ncbi:ankyrin-2 [Aricia agestis]|uniref:ankyrin-2 n=1 Tax=Aricia agestis TaxID=91739 RepID=UPI001C205669|nr:ankyrin-2 [Aricia agestis]
MEAFEECSINNSSLYTTKPSILEESDIVASDSGDCHQTNGVDVVNTENGTQPNDVTDIMESEQVGNEACKEEINDDAESKLEVEPLHETAGLEPTSENLSVPEEQVVVVTNIQNQNEDVISEVVTEVTIDGVEHDSTNVACEGNVLETKVEEEKEVETEPLELSQNEVQFQTEILVEQNDNDVNENIVVESKPDAETIILSELDHNIELSEVLQSDIADGNDTHSGSIRQEVFNKEELLDILEGNDGDQASIEEEMEEEENKKKLEAQIALKQLSRLSKTRYTPKKTKGEGRKPLNFKKRSNPDTNTNKKQEKDMGKQLTAEKETDVDIKIQEKNSAQQLTAEKTDTSKEDTKTTEEEEAEPKKENDKIAETENIVSSLVMDWDDDEPIESKELDTSKASKISEISTDNVAEVGEPSEESQDTPTEETVSKQDYSQNTDKAGDDEPPRRISRVIKKKVIFDPDNPDTFTKGKIPLKNKDSAEPTPPKKPKPEQIRQRSKSPVSKQQWKKPSPKNSKQCRRLTEVDKLLMDEGAVNMLYQLTPDAPKGKKNMKTKAEIIKKLQSSTPEAKEKGRFRERKKEIIKYEDGEAKKIISGKLRASLSASVKSPSVSEDFETHSADDSIIYRRHSSSSYSSSCMSPRRLSDVETGSVQNTTQKVKENTAANLEETVQQVSESFMAENEAILSSKEIDCLSIKEKLNSKLSQALNKRKRDNTKNDKPVKQKKLSKDDNIPDISGDQFKFVSIVIENKLATVFVKKTAVKIGIEVIKELEEALLYLDKLKDTSVTLLSSECVVLCSSLDLNFLLEENKETRVKQAYTLADSIRLLLCSAAQHSKLLCCSVWGACCGVGLALATFCDVVLASECATFALAMGSAPLFPGTAALTVRCQALPQALINDLVVFGRRISSGEALRSGLISRTLWPDRFQEQVENIVRDIATQPQPTILLKKKLLNLRNSVEEARLSSCLEAERDLLVEYWTSVEGQELLRATLDCA